MIIYLHIITSLEVALQLLALSTYGGKSRNRLKKQHKLKITIIASSFFLVHKQNMRNVFVITITPTSILFTVNNGNTGAIKQNEQNEVNNVAHVPLLLTLNRFHKWPWCFLCGI